MFKFPVSFSVFISHGDTATGGILVYIEFYAKLSKELTDCFGENYTIYVPSNNTCLCHSVATLGTDSPVLCSGHPHGCEEGYHYGLLYISLMTHRD